MAIFVPSFVFVALLSRILPFAKESGAPPGQPWSALDWINAASLGLMGAVTYQLAVASIIDPFTIATLLVAAAVVFRTKVNAIWPMLVGGVAGALYRLTSGGY